MRPIRLELSGLTCFRETCVIDFGALGLVAIEGPTGAGKSSLLDAMILALYGSVPRMGSQHLAELISHGRQGLAVKLDFEVRGTRWRVARTVNRGNRPSQAILSQLVVEDGAVVEKKKFDGVKDVQLEVKALIGIDVKAFQQAVILPQGQFQEFLKSQPAERRRILGELLGLQVYALMRQKAQEIANRLGAEVEALGRQLSGDLALASAEHIAELELQLQVVRDEREATRALAEAARAGLAEIERTAERCATLKRIDLALVVIEARAGMIADLEERVARARAVLPIVPLVTRVEAAAVRVAGLAQRVLALAGSSRAAAAALEQAQDDERAAAIAAEQITTLRARIAQLDEARGRFEQREEFKGRAGELERELTATRRTRAEAEGDAGLAAREQAVIAERLAALAARDVPAVAPEELQRWESLREPASRVSVARAQLEREIAQVEAAYKAVSAREGELTAAELERKRKEHGELAADEQLEAAHKALALAEQDARVALMREHLHAGEPCPVCEQVVSVVPAAQVQAEVATLRAAVGAAKGAVERARSEAERARAKVAESRAKASEAAARIGAVDAAAALTRAAIARDEELLASVVDQIDQIDQIEQAAPIELRFRAGLEALAARAKGRAAHDAALAQERLALERAGLQLERHAALLSAAGTRVVEIEREVALVQERLSAIEAQLAGLAAADPKKERAALERAIEGLDQRRAATRDAVAAAHARAAEVGADQKALDALAAEARAEAAAAGAELDASGWTGDEVRDATLAPEALTNADTMIASHRGDRAARTAEREAIVRALGPHRAGPAEVDAARAALVTTAAGADAAAERYAVLGERLRQAREQLERASGVRAEHEAKQRQLYVYKRLSDDLGPRNFQEYLLEEVIADLVRGASARLFDLSGGRYRMAADSSAGFLVLDLDHAGERRSTDTLSGGETFLASLAMALELSEQIRAKAGKVDLDCIFIDEGFGSLDPETLETVACAVEGLQSPGRLVGIITHVADLARRMPERLLVEKSPTGSTVRALHTSDE